MNYVIIAFSGRRYVYMIQGRRQTHSGQGGSCLLEHVRCIVGGHINNKIGTGVRTIISRRWFLQLREEKVKGVAVAGRNSTALTSHYLCIIYVLALTIKLMAYLTENNNVIICLWLGSLGWGFG